jgi:hypothetical protein
MRVVRAAVGTPLVRMVPIAVVRMVSIAVVGMFSMSAAAQQPAPTQPPTQPPAQPGTVTQTPGAPQTPGQPPGVQPPASTPAPQPRVFTAPAGLLINTVRPDRVDDFEKAMGYLQAALASSTNERVREQAAGWRVFKATETGPNNAVLYVFMLDPTVPGADYSLGRILADAYPDQAKLQEIWKLYSGSVTGGHLLNLTPLKLAEPLKIP